MIVNLFYDLTIKILFLFLCRTLAAFTTFKLTRHTGRKLLLQTISPPMENSWSRHWLQSPMSCNNMYNGAVGTQKAFDTGLWFFMIYIAAKISLSAASDATAFFVFISCRGHRMYYSTVTQSVRFDVFFPRSSADELINNPKIKTKTVLPASAFLLSWKKSPWNRRPFFSLGFYFLF